MRGYKVLVITDGERTLQATFKFARKLDNERRFNQLCIFELRVGPILKILFLFRRTYVT